jgi:hypothetical protein
MGQSKQRFAMNDMWSAFSYKHPRDGGAHSLQLLLPKCESHLIDHVGWTGQLTAIYVATEDKVCPV